MELLVKYGASIQAITEVRLFWCVRISWISTVYFVANIVLNLHLMLLLVVTATVAVSFFIIAVWSDSHARSCFHGSPQHRFTSTAEWSFS